MQLGVLHLFQVGILCLALVISVRSNLEVERNCVLAVFPAILVWTISGLQTGPGMTIGFAALVFLGELVTLLLLIRLTRCHTHPLPIVLTSSAIIAAMAGLLGMIGLGMEQKHHAAISAVIWFCASMLVLVAVAIIARKERTDSNP